MAVVTGFYDSRKARQGRKGNDEDNRRIAMATKRRKTTQDAYGMAKRLCVFAPLRELF